MKHLFFIVGYPLRLLLVLMVCLIEPGMWDRRKQMLEGFEELKGE